MQALILAGGKGTRMGDAGKTIPKPLMLFSGKPLLAYHLEWLRKYGVIDILILVNHLGDQIKEYARGGEEWGVRVRYAEEHEPLGTAGGVSELREQLNDDFLLVYGDVLANVDLCRLMEHHKNNKKNDSRCVATLVTHPNRHPFDSDLVDIDAGNRIIAFFSKPHPPDRLYRNIVNAALYILSPGIAEYIPADRMSDFGKDVFPAIVAEGGHSLYAYHTSEYLKDMGTPERLAEVERDVMSGRFAAGSLDVKRPAVFIDRDGVINEQTRDASTEENFTLISGAAEAIRLLNDKGFYAVVITNQPEIAKGFCTVEDVLTVHKKMETELGNDGAQLDGIYFCPHHPDKGFPNEVSELKIACNCRKPAIGMLTRAAADLNIDLSKSYFIGDSTRDAMAAENAGVEFIGVKTGYGCADGCYSVAIEPGMMKENLLGAVKHIISI